jgi:hypothetical protein
MAKRPQPRAFFEILREERQAKTERDAKEEEEKAEQKPAPLVRRRREPEPPPPPPEPAPEPPAARAGPRQSWTAGLKARLANGTVTLSYFWVGVILIGVVCLSVLCLAIGARMAGPSLPDPPREPGFSEIRAEPPTPGLVGEGGPTTSGPTEGAETPTGGEGETTNAGTGGGETAPPPRPKGKYRVRIARLALGRTEYTDKLRDFLQRNGVETELDLRDQFYYLYTREHYQTKAEADRATGKVNNLKLRFARETRWLAEADAYPVSVD